VEGHLGAGQGIGAVSDIVPAKVIVSRMVEQYDAALAELTGSTQS
jgi:NAD(P)H-dependent flavin oxidoreductase YrpB (nitropropane dioxygenase family)